MVKVYQGVAIKGKALLLLQPNSYPIDIQYMLWHISRLQQMLESPLALSPEVACCED